MSAGSGKGRFLIAICAGSFLLFLVQPMVARMALPRLGGAPSVWNSAMLVYQALLLAGYGYAHALGRLAPRRQAMVHVVLFLLAALALPIGLFAAPQPPGLSPALWVLWLIGGSIGPLFFVVAAQAPLLQRWFALTGRGDPYPLYAASNLGSFAGLIAYPLLVEPFLPLGAQSLLWSAGYALLLLLTVRCTMGLKAIVAPERRGEATAAPPGWRVQIRWLALAAVPSGLLLSTSLHLTTDIVAMPLLWVVPLGLYLLSFSVAFSARRSMADVLAILAPFFLLMGAATAFVDATGFPIVVAAMTLLTLFAVATALHARLYDLRPDPVHLTRFYLVMSAGGMVGGLLCALIAPLLFDWTYEHPLLLFAAAVLLPRSPLLGWSDGLFDGGRGRWMTAALLVASLALSLVGGGMIDIGVDPVSAKATSFLILLVLAVVVVGRPMAYAVALGAMMLCLGGWYRLGLSREPGAMTRSYFGIYMVRDRPGQRLLVHGTTIHGIQNRARGREHDPTSYYAPASGVGLALRRAPQMFGPGARIGIVGLGAGTLACYARPGQSWRFYEIDPAMAAIARDPKAFTFLSHCLPGTDIVIGDARLTLARERPGSLDVIAVDAFSSDAIPMHLLTREAIRLYMRTLSPRGILMVHISNRFLNLRPVLAGAAEAEGLVLRERDYQPARRDAERHYSRSIWIAIARDRAALAKLEEGVRWKAVPPREGFAPWTDDHGSILPLLRRR